MSETHPAPPGPDMGDLAWVRDLLEKVFVIDDITMSADGTRTIRVRGHFLIDSSKAYKRLAPACRARGRTLLFRHEQGQAVLRILEGVVRPTPNNRWLPIALAVATVISVLFTYVILWEVPDPTWTNVLRNLHKGWAFTLSLLSILLAHELGHYFTARHFGVAVTLPYLIPFPLSPFGTMGAVIRMKDLPPSKRAMMLIGAAGPLAGLVVAIPVLILGLSLSEVGPLPAEGAYMMEGNSILYALLKRAVLGHWLPSGGEDVLLHPVALAGWGGLLVTAFNLIPAGQLDGGHVAYVLFGSKTRYLTWAIIAILLVLGIWWQGWFLWAVLIFLFSRRQVGPLDDISPLTWSEMALAASLLVLFVLLFTPLPMRIVGG